jgi:surface protein
MQSHTINQLVKINVYNTEADMPHGLALVWQGFIKYLPTIGLILLGLLAIFLIIYIIVNYHKAKRFWRNFSIAGALILLFGWGYYGVNQFTMPLTLGSDTIVIDIVKDTGSMTASTGNKLRVATKYTYGHNTYAKTVSPKSNVWAFGNTVFAEPEDGQIKLYINDLELTNSEIFLSTNNGQEDDYTIVADINPSIAAGTYDVPVELSVSERDSMMSVDNALSKTALADKTMTPTDQSFVTDADCKELYETNTDEYRKCLNSPSMIGKFHRWLNAPDPIRRENIKDVKFGNGVFSYSKYIYDTEKTVEENAALYIDHVKYWGAQNSWSSGVAGDERSHYDACWDISERQEGDVIACYVERVRTTEWAGSTLLDWFTGLIAGDATIQCENELGGRIAPVTDDPNTSVNEDNSSAVAARNQAISDCVAARKIPVFLGVYDVVIRQDGGVSAPQNSKGLFYYTGQNSGYCMYGSRTMVDPAIRDNNYEISSLNPISFAIETFKAWDAWYERIQQLLRTEEGWGDLTFWQKLMAESKIADFFNHCHEDYIDVDTTISFTHLKTDAVTNMSHMFEGATFANLTDRLADVKDTAFFTTDNVKDMGYMFANITVKAAGEFDSSKTGLKFDGVEDMQGMFKTTRFEKITMGGNTMNVANMSDMFAGAAGPVDGGSVKSGEIQITDLRTIHVTNMSRMFEGSTAKIYASPNKFLTQNVTDMSYMFAGAEDTTKKLSLKHFVTSNVTSMKGMFTGTKFSSVDLSNFNTENVTDMASMFENCDTKELDLSAFNTANVTDMSNMFFDATAETVNFGDNFKTNKVTNMSGMFANTVFEPVASSTTPLTFNTGEVTNMSNMFFNAKNLDFVDLTKFNTSKVTDMSYMFANFRIAPPVEGKGLFDGREKDQLYVADSKAKNEKLQEYVKNPYFEFKKLIADTTKWTNNVVDIFCAQENAENAIACIAERELKNWRNAAPEDYGKNYNTTTNLNLTKFNTSKVVNMEGMFLGIQYPSVSLNNDTFKTSKVKNMAYMFAMIDATNLDTLTAQLDTSNVENMEGMFAGTHLISNNITNNTLNLSSFKSDSLKNAKFMFAYNDIRGVDIPAAFKICQDGVDYQYAFEHKESSGVGVGDICL